MFLFSLCTYKSVVLHFTFSLCKKLSVGNYKNVSVHVTTVICVLKKAKAKKSNQGMKPCRGVKCNSRGEDVVTEQPAARSLC